MIGILEIKLKQNSLSESNNLPSLNKKVNPYKACIYGLCRDFFDGVGYDLGTNCLFFKKLEETY